MSGCLSAHGGHQRSACYHHYFALKSVGIFSVAYYIKSETCFVVVFNFYEYL